MKRPKIEEYDSAGVTNWKRYAKALEKFCDWQSQPIEELKAGLKEIERLCDNQNETHEAIWRIANELLKTNEHG